MNITIVDHPLIQHKLTLMWPKETPISLFRRLVNEIAMLLGYEVMRDLALAKREIETFTNAHPDVPIYTAVVPA